MVLGGERERMLDLVSCAASAAADIEAAQAAEGGTLAAVASAPTGGRPGVAGGGREPVGLPCPRCESVDTKFCYYNNYNLSQPRHFCKGCRRYWTRGGALRNVPVGGGTRKATPATRRKRTGGGGTPPASTPLMAALPRLTVSGPPHGALLRQYGVLPFPATSLASPLAAVDPDRRLLDLGGSFSSRIAAADPDRRLLDLGGSFSSLVAAAPPPDVVGAHHFSAGFLVGGLAAPALAHSQAQAAAALPPPPLPPQQVSQALPEGLIWGGMGMGWPDLSI